VTPLLHVALPGDWAAAVASGEYTTSTRGVTLADEGFIHCSYSSQLLGVVNRFYSDVPELVLLTIDRKLLDAPVVDEPPADGVDDLFPHVYGPIAVGAVVSARPWRRDADGTYRLPDELTDS
jgi:uncharacterized protein (DUF952 family)